MTTKRILIIDDDLGIRQIVQISLEAIANWGVLPAPSGLEGLALAQQEQPDAILLDLMMPEMDGIATLEKLKANPATQSIPVILMTAKAQRSSQHQFAQLALAGVIVKPFKAPDLVKQIKEILKWED